MKYFALFYHVVEDFLNRRMAVREEHLKLVRDAHERGEIVMGGALGDPVDRAMIIFRVEDRSMVEDFARNDPYVTRGLVQRWEVQPWNVVIGGKAGS
jgi:uncharacterized protein YciI